MTDTELHAYADGMLPEQAAAAVEAYLAVHAADAERALEGR